MFLFFLFGTIASCLLWNVALIRIAGMNKKKKIRSPISLGFFFSRSSAFNWCRVSGPFFLFLVQLIFIYVCQWNVNDMKIKWNLLFLPIIGSLFLVGRFFFRIWVLDHHNRIIEIMIGNMYPFDPHNCKTFFCCCFYCTVTH